MNQRVSAVLTAGMALAVLGSCSGSTGEDPVATPASPTTVTSPSPTTDPSVQKALAAYEGYSRTSTAAQENPVAKGEKLPASADFERWTYDPLRAQTRVFIYALHVYNAEYRGKAPISSVSLSSVDLSASPYPIVKLTDCLVPQGEYVPFNRKTGKRLHLEEEWDPNDPYLLKIDVIAVKGHWGVKNVEIQDEAPCEPCCRPLRRYIGACDGRTLDKY